MYASNEDEDWIYLHKTPPVHTVLQTAMKFVNRKCSNSSESDPSISLSSISAIELEDAQSDDISLLSSNSSIEQDDPLLISRNDISSIKNDNPDIKTSVTTNDNNVFNTGLKLRNASSKTNSLRRRIGRDSHTSDKIPATPNSHKPQKRYENQTDTLISCTCVVVLLSLSFILGQMIAQWNQPTLNTISKELIKTNQRLNVIKDIPIKDFEEKLTKQLENKIENLINQQLTWQADEKSLLTSQIHELQIILNKTQQNLTDTIHQLTNENEQLKEQIKLLEYRLPKEQYPKAENINSSKPLPLTFNKLFTNIYKQTSSMNISNIFENLSATVSNIIDYRHEYIKESKRKLFNLTSFRKAKTTYVTWIKSHAKIRMNINKKYPWRSIFRHGYNRERLNSSKFSTSIKTWIKKFF